MTGPARPVAARALDLDRALDVIRLLRLRGPHDGPGTYTVPTPGPDRHALADLVYDLADEHAARAILDLPARPRRTVAYPTVAPDEHPTPAAVLKLRHAAVHRAAAHRRR